MANAAPAAQMSASQQNALARQLILKGGPGILPAINRWQQIFSQTYTSGIPGMSLTVPITNTGLIKRMLVKVTGKIDANTTSQQNRGPFGPAALFSSILLTDYDNQQRHNAPGWAFQLVASAKRRRVYGAAYTTDTPFGYGSNYTVNAMPATIAANGNGTFTYYLEVPISRSDDDLRGFLWGNITSSNAFLTLNINPNPFVSSTADGTFALYKSAGSDLASFDGTTGITITVFQNYLDQIPRDSKGAPILPAIDWSYDYLIQTGNATGLVANAAQAINYPNFRDILSTSFVYDNAGTLNAGSDISAIAIQSANLVNVQQLDPVTTTLLARNLLGDDPPAGCYYLDHNHRPINAQQYGNWQLLVTPSSVGGSTAALYYAMEMVGLRNVVLQAGSLQAGG